MEPEMITREAVIFEHGDIKFFYLIRKTFDAAELFIDMELLRKVYNSHVEQLDKNKILFFLVQANAQDGEKEFYFFAHGNKENLAYDSKKMKAFWQQQLAHKTCHLIVLNQDNGFIVNRELKEQLFLDAIHAFVQENDVVFDSQPYFIDFALPTKH